MLRFFETSRATLALCQQRHGFHILRACGEHFTDVLSSLLDTAERELDAGGFQQYGLGLIHRREKLEGLLWPTGQGLGNYQYCFQIVADDGARRKDGTDDGIAPSSDAGKRFTWQ